MRWNKLYIGVSCTRLAEEYYSKEQALCSSFQSKNNLVLGKVWVSMWLPYTHVYCDYVSALFIQYDFNAMQYMWTDNGCGITLDTHNCSERDWSIHAFDTSYLPWSEQTSIFEINALLYDYFRYSGMFQNKRTMQKWIYGSPQALDQQLSGAMGQ